MKLINFSIALFFIPLINPLLAQSNTIICTGLLRSQLTLSPGFRFKSKESSFYAHGTAEYYLEKNTSVAGEAYLGLGTIATKTSTFTINHSVLFGVIKHLVFENHDLSFGFQPGVSYVQLNDDGTNISRSKGGIAPVISGALGYNYFISRYFHFFMQGRILIGQHNYNQKTNLTEFRLSAGLGFNFNSKNGS